ncbi:DUF6933 domain-containing protein [Paenibacillus eucommiae]|uniref:DUF6933 domain-containing protein n=1 Tax=Paenibacillus eucommiae TaxID=1355755 RepID=A0ABS4J7B8_9BACL|nr:hypothetical protein [Paenibacillus eucommiae]MBP1995717.1 hypothetical protein [Paenibacillus eucommiae]
MIVLQLTKKLAAELKAPLADKPDAFRPLYGWHAHYFVSKRRKCVLLMNNETSYNFMIFGLVQKDFKRFNALVAEHLSKNLLADGMDQVQIDQYLQSFGDIHYSPTSDRSILSQINEVIMYAQHRMEDMTEVDESGIYQINRFLNRYVFLKLSKYSREIMKDALDGLSLEKSTAGNQESMVTDEKNVEDIGKNEKNVEDIGKNKKNVENIEKNEKNEKNERKEKSSKEKKNAGKQEGNTGAISMAAMKKWLAIPENTRREYTKNAWCWKCSDEATIKDYSVELDKHGIILEGKCASCDSEISRYIEN